jgi:hypothetical protein
LKEKTLRQPCYFKKKDKSYKKRVKKECYRLKYEKEKRLKKETKHQRSPSEPYKLELNSQTRNPLNY